MPLLKKFNCSIKKRLVFPFAFIIYTTSTFSQTNNSGSVALAIGPASPTGQFANNNLYNESAGFARIGETIYLEYTKAFSKHWAILINLAGQRNPINTDALESSFSKAKIYQGFYFGSDPNNPPPQNTYQIYPDWNFDKKSWLYGTFQVGVKGQFPMSKQKKIWLTTEASIGVLYATSPQLKGSSITDTASALIWQDKSTGFGMGYSFGGGVKYCLNNTLFFTTTLKYAGSNKITFKDVKTTLTTTKGAFGSPDYSISQSISTTNGQQIFNSISLQLGIGIIL